MKPGGTAVVRQPAGGPCGGAGVEAAAGVAVTIDPAPDGTWDWAVWYLGTEVWRDSAPTEKRAREAALRVARVVAIKP